MCGWKETVRLPVAGHRRCHIWLKDGICLWYTVVYGSVDGICPGGRGAIVKGLRRCLVVTLAVVLAVLSPATAGASQVHGHLLFAGGMLVGPVARYLADDPKLVRMYLLGAAAPDSLWMAHLATVPEVRALLKERYRVDLAQYVEPLPSPVADVHRARPVKVALSLLAAARTPEESAYALGWISHFIADARIHALVNRWGGFYDGDIGPDDARYAAHNSLEALESRHVLTRYRDDLDVKYFAEEDARSPGDFVVRALAAAYPVSPAFRPPEADAFIRLLDKTDALLFLSSRWAYYQGTHDPREIARAKGLLKRFRPELGRMTEVLTDLPGREEYLKTLVRSPFIGEWEIARKDILADGREILPLCVLYLWQRQHGADGADGLLERIGGKLRCLAPGDDLINPRP